MMDRASCPGRIVFGTSVLVSLILAGPTLGPAGLVAPPPAFAQELTGWTIIHSTRAFDYLVSDSVALEGIAGDSPEIVRMFVAQMLTRRLDSVRAEMVTDPARGRIPSIDGAMVPALRQAQAVEAPSPLRPDDYLGYASSTHVIEVRCSDGRLRRGRSTDFAEDGSVLAAWEDAARWREPSDFEEPTAMERLVAWACRRGA